MYLIFFYVNINIGDCMLVRLGYVAISTAIDVTSSSPYTYSEYLNKCNIDKLDDVIKSNLLGLEEILKYNVKNNIHFYRMSSKIIPLATKDDVKFNYTTKYEKYYNRISKIINDNNLRVDFHPDQFCVLNSTNKDVVKNSIDIFSFWNKLSKEMRIQTEDKLRLDSIAEQQMREEKILADRDLERYKRTHRILFCEETKYMPKEGVI